MVKKKKNCPYYFPCDALIVNLLFSVYSMHDSLQGEVLIVYNEK